MPRMIYSRVNAAALTLFLLTIAPANAQTETTVDFILNYYNNVCHNMRDGAEFSERDLYERKGKRISLLEHGITRFGIGIDGKVPATIVWTGGIKCDGATLGFCGSSGCAFHVVVDEWAYDFRGFRPQLATSEGENFILLPLSGWSCSSEAFDAPKSSRCYKVAAWSEQLNRLMYESEFAYASKFNIP